ncbi:HSCB C-terminal oligomerization domain-containing protein [Microdochium trichocladiopsis]|uniref:HSCB C-terminal oligomerization domain-containing protein n=1 Tax=Microdochium trichocladiopsis TaxID=1682393 RepID=A0A9P8Y027_9PEZI|nr:HSCB C-terminal oligomerization domain-containing protein [Microdochium trichocladiopsis]KAH7026329.1 HSCB C-terminal oligomerization domain-containing protein [Microdochium trichocladiopsis]
MMRSALVPRGRPLARICEHCRHERAISTRSWPTAPRQAQSSAGPSPVTSSSSLMVTKHQQRLLSTTVSQSQAASSAAAVSKEDPAAAADDEASSSTTLPPPPSSHYDFFPQTLPQGPPPAGPFAIDQRALRREFLRLQAKAHPDLHPPHLKARAEATSARINEAYKTLSSPLLRAQYLLDTRLGPNAHPSSDEAAKVEDPELLMQVLEAREVIEDAEDESELVGLRAENDERVRESEASLGEFFAADDLESAKHECVRLRYWVNIGDTLHHWEKGKPVVLQH